MIENIQEKVCLHDLHEDKRNPTIILPHCTWDKFGKFMANNGGRIYGLFNELVSFFSAMNMYLSLKAAVQDNREYQDFLKMFIGKAKKVNIRER